MITQANSANVRNAYTSASDNKEVAKKAGAIISSQGDMSKVQLIQEALESGEYKINIQALSEKIADELL